MSLETGQYYITSAEGNYPIGRRSAEDRSLNPKGIFKLPIGTESVWELEKLANGNYRLRNRGAIVGAAFGLLFAFLRDGPEPVPNAEWNFIPNVARGDDAFVVSEGTGPLGWVLPQSSEIDPYPQVTFAVQIVQPSEPPTYPTSQVFIFKKVDA